MKAMEVRHLDHLNLTVQSFEETAAWYERVFGFVVMEKGLYRGHPWGVLQSGEALLCVYESPERIYLDGNELLTRGMHGINHFALRISDRDQWERVVEREKIEVEYGGALPYPNSTSWYISDPTGYEIEVVLWHGDKAAFAPMA